MTNINCLEKCIYQKDGKCSLESICHQKINSYQACAYFKEANQKNFTKYETKVNM